MIKNILPEVYIKYFPNSILEFNIEEKKATCSSCAMRTGHSPIKKSYHPNLKCCTFHPFQANYLIGNIFTLKNSPIEVLTRLEKKIETREYVLPIGIVAPAPHQIEFAKFKAKEFGNREDWLCPYYDRVKNNCGIWNSRNSTCTSFHCISSYGKNGFLFWDKISNYISFIEMAFMEEILLRLDFSPMEISEQIRFLNPQKKIKNPPHYFSEEYSRKIWKNFYENQIEFYIKCFEIANNFTPKEFKKILGNQGKIIEKELVYSKKALIF